MLGFTFINIGEMVRTMGFNCGRDEERDCDILDEDRVCGCLTMDNYKSIIFVFIVSIDKNY
tara:strand:+ start:216 stop:398 length:183 start_codon:yes stop_codon:yes gene_type:complete